MRRPTSDFPITCATLLLLVMSGGTTFAAVASDQDDEKMEEIVVTGSRIVRRDVYAPSPVMTVSRDALSNSGQATLEESLNQLPQVTPDMGRTSNNPGSGTSFVNLRGLGPGRNLVLLNGRRVAPSGIGSAVDLNNLPKVLIDRVEIITGGAAAVYGSDAIAGVVNFITRSDFEGLAIETSAYSTEVGDAENYDANLTWGHDLGGGDGHLVLYGTWLDRHALFAGDRAFTAVPLLDTWEGQLILNGSGATPAGQIRAPLADLGNGPVNITFTPDGNPVAFVYPDDLYNYAPVNYLQVPLTRYAGGALFEYALSDRIETYVEINYAHNHAARDLAPVPAYGQYTVNLDNPVLTPMTSQVFADNFTQVQPGIVQFSLARRLVELGPRIIDDNNDYRRIVAGVRGRLWGGWDYDAWLTYTRGKEQEQYLNDASRTRLQQGLLVDPATGQCVDPSNGCVPVDIFGAGHITPEAAAFIGYRPFTNDTTREQKLFSAYLRGHLMQDWAGPVSVALGIDWRGDVGSFHADSAFATGDALGFGGNATVIGEENVREIYGEAVVPLASDLPLVHYAALEVGARHSEYRHAGSVSTYKYGGEWQPVGALRVRAMVQHSMRAPNLQEAFTERYVEYSSLVGVYTDWDPCSASADPVGNGNVQKCIDQGIPANQIGTFEATPFYPTTYIDGGNPALTPESADTFTLGTVFNLSSWGTLSVDYYNLKVSDTIGVPDPRLVCFSPTNTAGVLCDKMKRDATFNVSEIDERLLNLGRMRNRGIDTQFSFKTVLPPSLALEASADLSLDLIWTHLLEFSIQQNEAAEPEDCTGKFGGTCLQLAGYGPDTFPRNRITTDVGYVSGDFDLHLTWRWIGGSDNGQARWVAQYPGALLQIPHIESVSYVDLGLGYRFNDHATARLVVANVLDKGPPLMADAAPSNNTDTNLYDIYGRSYQLKLNLTFGR